MPHHLDIITCTLIVFSINIDIYDSIQTMIHFCNQPIFSAEIMGFEGNTQDRIRIVQVIITANLVAISNHCCQCILSHPSVFSSKFRFFYRHQRRRFYTIQISHSAMNPSQQGIITRSTCGISQLHCLIVVIERSRGILQIPIHTT